MKYLRNETEAQDAVMNIFEKLFHDLLQHEIVNFRSWLHSVCRNHCLMQLRKPDLSISLSDDDDENESLFMKIDSILHQEYTGNDNEEKLQELETAIQDLKDQQKKCIELFYLKRKSYEEIATLTGYTNHEVKSHIQNGKRNLKIALMEKGITWITAWIIWIAKTA